MSNARRQRPHTYSPQQMEETMYQSILLEKAPRSDLTIVVTFALIGLALSLWAIGKAGLIDPEYLADLFLLF